MENDDWTKLVWTFEAVPIDTLHFPLGVRTTYRAYAADVTPELVRDSTTKLGNALYNIL